MGTGLANLSLEAIDRSLAADSLVEFTRQAWSIIEPTTQLRFNWHHEVICEYLEGVVDGAIRRLLINVLSALGQVNPCQHHVSELAVGEASLQPAGVRLLFCRALYRPEH